MFGAASVGCVTVMDLPQPGMARVLEELGATLLTAVGDSPSPTGDLGPVKGIAIYDALDEPELTEGLVVLGVGLDDPDEIASVVERLGERGGTALILRAPVEPTEGLIAAQRRAGVAVLAFARGASWTDLAQMIRSLTIDAPPAPELARPGAGQRQIVGYQSGLGDLFAVANAVAALVGAPITIEDRSSRLLAFSGRQENTDRWRVQTILRRQVPEEYTRVLEERGVFQEIYRSNKPVYVAPISDDEPQGRGARAVIAIRAADEILGTIWAAVAEPLGPEGSQALQHGAALVAMHMVWQRAEADQERRLRAELLATALDGGPRALDTMGRLGLKDEPAVVLAMTVVGPEGEHPLPAQLAVERKRLADAFALHLTAVHPRSAVGLVGDVTYGILPVPRDRAGGEVRALEIATEFFRRVGSRQRPLAGVGPVVGGAASLNRSRAGADRALRVLRSRRSSPQVARLDDVHLEALLLELADRLEQGDIPSGPIARIVAYDREHQSSLLETLRAWLDTFGDVPVAASAIYAHANTFRYRLRRATEVGAIDLDDPNARLAAMLQLRLMDLTAGTE